MDTHESWESWTPNSRLLLRLKSRSEEKWVSINTLHKYPLSQSPYPVKNNCFILLSYDCRRADVAISAAGRQTLP